MNYQDRIKLRPGAKVRPTLYARVCEISRRLTDAGWRSYARNADYLSDFTELELMALREFTYLPWRSNVPS